MNIGIDWDDTTDLYGKAIGKLAVLCDKKVIITLNRSITPFKAVSMLGPSVSDYIVEIMPDDAFDSMNPFDSAARWKHKMCLKHDIDVMIDDDETIVRYLESKGISCIKVDGEFRQ